MQACLAHDISEKCTCGFTIAMSSTKRKCTSYTTQFKLQVINFAEENSNRAAEVQFSVSEKFVTDCRKAEGSLEKLLKTRKGWQEKVAKYPEMEKKLFDWVSNKKSNGYIVTMLQIQLQALKFSNDVSFKASND